MTDNKQHDTRTTRRPDCVTEIRMGNSILVVSGYFKKDTTTTGRRQNGAGTGSGSRCYTKTGNLTNHKEADFALLPLYSPPLFRGTIKLRNSGAGCRKRRILC